MAFRKSIELSGGGTFATPHSGLGRTLRYQKQSAEAQVTISEGLELDPADAPRRIEKARPIATLPGVT